MVQVNWPIAGHKKIVEFLQKSIANNRLAHAYLFYGSQNVGKGLVALNFISEILTKNSIGRDKNLIQEQIRQKSHPDVFWIEKLENKRNISIDQVRDLRINLNLSPFSNGHKIVIINNAEELSEAAANSFLKILEETPSKTIIILLVNNLKRILPTITSRCQLIKFNPVPLEEIKKFLVNKLKVKAGEAEILSQLSFGRPGLIVDWLEQKEKSKEYQQQIKFFIKIINGTLHEKINFVSQIEDVPFFAWQIILRDMLLFKNNLPIINSEIKISIERLIGKWSEEKIYAAIKSLERTEKLFRFNINKKLALENFFINL
ncbi:MAG: hypothetical protein PHV78_02750 [Patescibacteria group bacterium]|nr:hypothetical protein [Patescibacteria group bacterium]MDD5121694.1 hypothetical protein [Patescibacteria group bacterium]MDD5221689.1 hypothetical protein [Patescibacteria group bacterium]MDD5396142.1 hypothetical protein [Patescibacteria group bacterium]